jgi:hypothetical protein
MRPFFRVVGGLAGALLQRARQLPTIRPTPKLPSRVRDAVERSIDLIVLKIVINITRH